MGSCTKCGNPNVIIKRKASGQALCKGCFIESIEKKVKQTIKKENFIEKGDKVLVALSGGKDSVVTLEILNSYVKRHIIELCAVTIDEGIAGYREEGVEIAKAHAERLGIPHKVVSFKECFDIDLDEIMKRKTIGDPVPIAVYSGDGLSIGLQGNLVQPRLQQVII
jgi:Predicted ATPase of the PP-loop superfamily implicated in cell cycle control